MKTQLMKQLRAKINGDQRITIWHRSILLAISEIAAADEKTAMSLDSIRISRKRVMELARLRSIPTYHKYMKELQTMGYIVYSPSYHPMLGSKVKLLMK